MNDEIKFTDHMTIDSTGEFSRPLNVIDWDKVQLPIDGDLKISVSGEWSNNTVFSVQSSDIWAKIERDLTVSHLDMDLCAKGPQNAYTALALAIWNKALETAASEVFCDDSFYNDEIHQAILELKK